MDALELLKKEIEAAGWPFEELLDHAAATPAWWAELTPQQMVQRLRWVREICQAELGWESGIGQSHVARIEAGADCRISTLWRLFKGLGYKPIIVAAYGRPEPREDPRLRPSLLSALDQARAERKMRESG